MSGRGPAVLAAALVLALAGCGSTFDSKVDYKSERKLPPLDIPPDLTTPGRDERYQIPDGKPQGGTTFSDYTKERTAAPKPGSTPVLPDVDKVRIERTASERWLVVPEPPEKVWPVVKNFWQDMGFLIKTESPEVGVMETDWAENRAKIKEDAIRNAITGFLSGGNSTGERDKFRTRLERGALPNTTEIYISHRGVSEVYVNQYHDSTTWQARPVDPGLEAEFLRRLMMRFGVDEARAKVLVASDQSAADSKAKIVAAENGGNRIELAEPFDRAWRRVGLVLDRVGFTVEDRDRSKGTYYVRYVDPEADALGKTNTSFISKLMFWRSAPDPKAEQYRVFVKDRNESSEVQVLGKEGAPDTSDTARKILALLQQQLK
jgi:outer membrane protein assembly factor BamC